MSERPITSLERRVVDRRIDKRTARLLARAFAMGRGFGFATALAILLRNGWSETKARDDLASRYDRRRRPNRR